jgi:serine O-acetyltransferase
MSAEADLAMHCRYEGPLRHLRAFVLQPGYRVVRLYRLVLKLETMALPLRACGRLLAQHLLTAHACHLSPKAGIGPGLSLPHPIAVVIGDGCRLGRSVTLYQSVTLGRGHADMRYPVLEDEVVVYAGAVIAGGVRIGRGAVIGANAVVTHDVPAGGTVRAGGAS